MPDPTAAAIQRSIIGVSGTSAGAGLARHERAGRKLYPHVAAHPFSLMVASHASIRAKGAGTWAVHREKASAWLSTSRPITRASRPSIPKSPASHFCSRDSLSKAACSTGSGPSFLTSKRRMIISLGRTSAMITVAIWTLLGTDMKSNARISKGKHSKRRRAPSTVNGTVPARRVLNTTRRPREYLTVKEVMKLMDRAREHGRYGRRDATMILVAYRHGLRPAELCALRWHQVDLGRGLLHVRRIKNGMPGVPSDGRASDFKFCNLLRS